MNWPAAILKAVSTSLLWIFTHQFDSCSNELHELGLRGGTFQAYYVVFSCLIALGYTASLVGFASVFCDERTRIVIGVGKGVLLLFYDVPKLITVMCLLNTTDMSSGSYLMASMTISAVAKAFSMSYAVYHRNMLGWIQIHEPTQAACVGSCTCLLCVIPIFVLMLVQNSRQCGDSTCPSIEDMQCA